MTILTCYATSIIVINLNLSASLRLFTFDTYDFVNKTSRYYKGGASGNGAIGYRRKLPSVEITLPQDTVNKVSGHRSPNSRLRVVLHFEACLYSIV